MYKLHLNFHGKKQKKEAVSSILMLQVPFNIKERHLKKI
ncbi:conserved hypothetical protein [delta proteobacterium NaphS2]|nr:conserved hypothetical protein [delta proteobacterium NaphS2]